MVKDEGCSEVNRIDRKRERRGDGFLSNELHLGYVLRRDWSELLEAVVRAVRQA
jgi:hypothetical protein